MIKRISLLLCLSVSLLATAGCGNYEPWDEFEAGNVSESVKSDFYRRYSDDVIVKEAMDYGNTSRIEFIDTDGLPCTAIYKGEYWVFTWKEYSKDNFLFLSQLPKKVARGYIRGGIDDEDYTSDNSYVIEVSRSGFDQKYYEFHCAAPYVNGNLQYIHDCHVLIGENGEVIDVQHTSTNPSTWFYDMDEAVTSVRTKYPGAIVIGAVNEGGRNVVYIKDEGISKRVLLGNDNRWIETVIKLGKWFKLPDNVMNEYARYKSEHPDFEYSEVYKVERKDGIYYGLKMMVLKGSQIYLTVYFKA